MPKQCPGRRGSALLVRVEDVVLRLHDLAKHHNLGLFTSLEIISHNGQRDRPILRGNSQEDVDAMIDALPS